MGGVYAARIDPAGEPPPPSADLALTLTDAPDPAVVGADLVYRTTVVNRGPSPAAWGGAASAQTSLSPVPNPTTRRSPCPAFPSAAAPFLGGRRAAAHGLPLINGMYFPGRW